MKINQISIFIENKYGRLAEIFSLLADSDIHVIATTVADTSEYGILRLIVNEPQRAFRILTDANVSANLTGVFAFRLGSSVDSLSNMVATITQSGVSVEYLYCFSHSGGSIVVMRTNNDEATMECVRRSGFALISESELLHI